MTQNIHCTPVKYATGLRLSALLLALSLSLGGAARVSAATLVLYDGLLGSLPSAQGMQYIGPGITPTVTGGVTNLDTSTANLWQAGFGALSPVSLDAALGYTLEFSAELISESSSSDVRAGFSVIVVGADPAASIEIGFQAGQVFAQNDDPLFGNPPAEANALFSPVGMGLVDYSLTVLGSSYSLLANGDVVLDGSLRDYSSFGLPYNVSSSIFLGDDTSSARADVNLSRVALVTPSQVPLPAAAWLFISALGGLLVAKRKVLTA